MGSPWYNLRHHRRMTPPIPDAQGNAMTPSEDDLHLLQRIQRKDAQALSLLYDRYARLVFSLALRIVGQVELAEDVTQEVFWRVWERADQYHPGRGSVRAWLLYIARNRALDVLRRRRRRPLDAHHLPDEGLPEAVEPDPGPEDRAVQSWERAQVREALTRLSEEQRAVLLLAYFEGLSHQQIAQRLNLPLGTVKSRLRAAMQALRRHLVAEAGHPPGPSRRI